MSFHCAQTTGLIFNMILGYRFDWGWAARPAERGHAYMPPRQVQSNESTRTRRSSSIP